MTKLSEYIENFFFGTIGKEDDKRFCLFLEAEVIKLNPEEWLSWYIDYKVDGKIEDLCNSFNKINNTKVNLITINKSGITITKKADNLVEVKTKLGYGANWKVELIKLENIIDLNRCPKNSPVEIYYSDGTPITITDNDLEFSWIRLQIARLGLSGCYIVFEGKKIEIDKFGTLNYQPKGCFDNLEKVLGELIQLDNEANPDYYLYKPFDKIQIISNGNKGIIKTKHRDGVEVIFDINAPTKYYKYNEIRKI